MSKKVFISGPIQGMENEQGYRETITKICHKLGYEVIDPWLREKVIYRKDEPCWWTKVPAENFVCRDLEDVERCDILVAYLPKLSAGSCMELFQAKRSGKKVLIVSDMSCISPWIIVHSDAVLNDFQQLEHALINFI
jgi:nucleoside 2-deoxyribosyltransferase